VNADLAQRIALVAHGNACVSGLIDRPADLLAENSAFEHVRSVEFRMRGRSIHRVDLWLSALARRGARRLWMRRDDLAIRPGSGLDLCVVTRWSKTQIAGRNNLSTHLAPGQPATRAPRRTIHDLTPLTPSRPISAMPET
jgi:hypothetical protein